VGPPPQLHHCQEQVGSLTARPTAIRATGQLFFTLKPKNHLLHFLKNRVRSERKSMNMNTYERDSGLTQWLERLAQD